MNESEQRGLGEFAVPDEGRPDEEAAVVAGDAGQAVSEVVDAADLKFPDSEGTVEMTVTQVDYTVEGSGATEYPVVHVFGRTAENEYEHVRVLGMEPYFYVPTEDIADRALTEEYDAILDTRTEDTNGERFESIRGKPLTKVVGRTPRDVGRIRDDFDEHYEADILFPNRFLIDKDVSSGLQVPARRLSDGRIQVRYDDSELVAVEAPSEADLRVNTFDIEVDDRQGFPEDGEEPIVCLTSHDSYRDEYIVWLYDAPEADVEAPESLPDYEPIADSGTTEVRTFDEEPAMLDAFVRYVEETNPDVLTGWNFEDFDMPYVLDRLEYIDHGTEYDLAIDRLSRVGEVWRSDWGGPDVKGRVVFDLLYGYKQIVIKELESFRLDAIGERELDVGKEHYSGDIGDLWEQDPEQLLEYNLRDVELCVEIDRKQDVVEFWNQVRALVGSKLEDAPTAGDAVDMYVLHKAYGEFALPSKGQQEAAEEFEGGAVFEPITGVKENVTVLDLKSLYPMSMATINSSPETKVDPEEYNGETYQSPDGTHFRKEPDGIMREMIDELLTEREEKKELRDKHEPGSEPYEQYDKQQASVKVVMNCFTPDTDVLTPEGVQNIRDLAVGDEVYSFDAETERMEVKPVTETHAYPEYDGELVDIRTSKTDFRVTPNHRMLVRKNEADGITEEQYSFVEAGNLDDATNYELPQDWTTEHGDELGTVDVVEYVEGEYEVWVRPEVHGQTFAAELGYDPEKVTNDDVGTDGYVFDAEEYARHREYIESVCEQSFIHRGPGRKWIPRTFDGDDFLDLLAWYVTEGNVSTSEETQFGAKRRGSATTIQLAQERPAVADGGATTERLNSPESNHPAIGDLLDRMGFDYYVDDRSYQFTSELLGETLERLCGGDSFEKQVPEFVFGLSEREKRRFLDTLVPGGGDRQPNSWQYTTSSERLRDDVLRLCTHLGLTANYAENSGSWRISVDEGAKNTLRMHRSSSTSTAENGVYCVTVADNHSLLAGRNGTFQFVGQSLYGVSGWDRFRLYDTEGAAAVTATGREVIEFTETASEEIGHEVAYGDTDSVMLSLGDDISKEEAIEESFDIEEHINERYDDFAADELNADAHRFQIEFEKLYRRFFQAGKKKRYAGHIVWKEGKDVDDIDITGFEYKRSDIAPITKQVQKEVIDMIVRGEDLDEVKEYLHEVISDFQEGNVDLDDVGIPGGIGKRLDAYDTDTAQVRGAKYANLLLGTNFQRGSKPKRLYLKKVHPEFWQEMESGADAMDPQRDPLYAEFKRDPDVICFEYAEEVPDSFEIDWDKMLVKTLKGPIERVIEALGLSWDEVKSGQEQTGLGQWG